MSSILVLTPKKKRGKQMNNQERIQKYIEEHCKNCKNKDKFECEIRVFQNSDNIYTRCSAYEKEV